MMLPALRIIGDADENTIALKVIFSKLCDKFTLSEEDKRIALRNGQSVMSNRVSWSLFYLNHAGLVERPQRGYYSISDIGRQLLQNPPKQITKKYLNQYPLYQQFLQRKPIKKAKSENTVAKAYVAQTTDEIIDEAIKNKEDDIRNELLDRILDISPRAFEKLIIDLMVKMNYGKDEGSGLHTGKSGDGGVDGIIYMDELHLDSVYLQAKLYAKDNHISVAQIREFAGVLDEKGVTKGVFVTTSEFTAGARNYAESSPKSLELVDGGRLTDLLFQFDAGVRVEQTINLKRIDREYLDNLE